MYIKQILKNNVFLNYCQNFVTSILNLVVYIPHRKYVKPHSSLWFSAVYAAVIAHRNHFFRLYQQNKSLRLNWSSDRLVTVVQGLQPLQPLPLEEASWNCWTYANKAEESITSQKIGSCGFWRISKSVLNKRRSVIHPLFYSPEVLSSAPDKAKLFAENVSKNSNLTDLGISLPAFPF